MKNTATVRSVSYREISFPTKLKPMIKKKKEFAYFVTTAHQLEHPETTCESERLL